MDLWSEHGAQVQRVAGSDQGEVRSPFDYHRLTGRWTLATGWISLAGSYADFGRDTRQSKVDLSGSTKRGLLEVDDGIWASRGRSYGADPGAWVTVGVPIRGDLSLHLGVEYMRWPATVRRGVVATPPRADTIPGQPIDVQPPILIRETVEPWRISAGIRRGVAIPLPFIPGRPRGTGATRPDR
jgi:hypothetical protein